jgi:hypothetical protein
MDGMFTTLHIVFDDIQSGERGVVTRHNAEAAARYGGFEKLVRAGAPMKAEDVEAVADRIMPFLSGGTPGRFFALIDADQHLLHRSGERRAAAGISKGDMVDLEHVPGPLLVYEVTHDPAAGTVLLQLSDMPLDDLADAQLLLLNLEHGTLDDRSS